MSVVAHEVFHAAFGAYKDNSPVWRHVHGMRHTYLDRLFDLAQNEGIAYYLTLIARTRGRLVMDSPDRVRTAFTDLDRNAKNFSRPARRPTGADLIRTTDTSEYWQNYGAITGMIIARREIDDAFGRAATLGNHCQHPYGFLLEVLLEGVLKRRTDYPQLSPALVQYIQQRQ